MRNDDDGGGKCHTACDCWCIVRFVTTVRAFHVVLVSEKLTEGDALSGANCLASDATTFGVVLSPPFSTRLLR